MSRSLVLDSLDAAYPMHSLGDDMLYERYRIAYARHQYTEAAGTWKRCWSSIPWTSSWTMPCSTSANSMRTCLKDPEKAKTYYEKLLFEQTGSIFVPEARDRFRKLRGDGLEACPTNHHHPRHSHDHLQRHRQRRPGCP